MKYIVVLGDGMADEPIRQLNGKTPLDYAYTPTFDKLAPLSEIGSVYTIPKGCSKGSDTANLSVLGYNPKQHYYGRSPLEALSMGVVLKPTDITFRVNFVTLSEEEDVYEKRKILDHSSDEISTEEASVLLEVIQKHFGDETKCFYKGVSYRHLMVWDQGEKDIDLVPPHDILDEVIGHHKPTGKNEKAIWSIMKESYELLNNHPINEARRKRGARPANSVWLWGEGTKPSLPLFKDKYSLDGAVISGVDLIKGIGVAAGMKVLEVEGATGNLHTNYKGKVEAALGWLIEEDKDFVYIHIEAPDECGHRGELDNKIKAIEWIDEKIVKPLITSLEDKGYDFKLMVVPDHPTPLRLRTHTDDPVPYMIYDSTHHQNTTVDYTEEGAKNSGCCIEKGDLLMKYFVEK